MPLLLYPSPPSPLGGFFPCRRSRRRKFGLNSNKIPFYQPPVVLPVPGFFFGPKGGWVQLGGGLYFSKAYAVRFCAHFVSKGVAFNSQKKPNMLNSYIPVGFVFTFVKVGPCVTHSMHRKRRSRSSSSSSDSDSDSGSDASDRRRSRSQGRISSRGLIFKESKNPFHTPKCPSFSRVFD